MISGIPLPSLITLPCRKRAYGGLRLYLFRIVLMTALNANSPRHRITSSCFSESISAARYAEQFEVSSGVGLFSGGAHLTAAVTWTFFSFNPSSMLRERAWLAKPVLYRVL